MERRRVFLQECMSLWKRRAAAGQTATANICVPKQEEVLLFQE